jgi:hypothetical protein
MKDGLLEKIQSTGYWRVNFRPMIPLNSELTFQQCEELVRDNLVSLRGWYFPHQSHQKNDNGGWSRGDNFYENWCDWCGFHEFWRMYKSGQFLYYGALREDTQEESRNGTLSILNAIYTITEFIEFAHRLHRTAPFRGGIKVKLELRNTAGRYLDVGPSRMAFFDRRETDANCLTFEHDILDDNIGKDHKNIAIDLLLKLFDCFGWNPARDQIAADQAKFYRREF